MATLVAYARVAYDEGRLWFHRCTWAHIVTLAVGVIGAIATTNLAYVMAVIALGSQSFAWYWKRKGEGYHALSREGMRRAMLVDALGGSESTIANEDLKREIGPHLAVKAEAYQATHPEAHYTSELTAGLHRLLCNLEESAYWTKHLYRRSAQGAMGKIVGFVAVLSMVGLAIVPFLPIAGIRVGAVIVVQLLLFTVAWDEFGSNLAWRRAARALDLLQERLERSSPEDLDALMLAFAEYAVATATTPPIPQFIYTTCHAELDQSWRQIMAVKQRMGQTAASNTVAFRPCPTTDQPV